MIRCFRRRGATFARTLLLCALTVTVAGCEEDTKPYITKLSANPLCGTLVMAPDSTLGLTVEFFGRASSGNRFDDPTGANSALEWSWDFNGDGRIDAQNVVQPSYRYTRAGDYRASLVVMDDDGDQDIRTLLVQIRDDSVDLDIVDFSADVTEALRFGITPSVNTALDEDGSERPIRGVVPESFPPVADPSRDLPLDERFVLAQQARFVGWRATFDGSLVPTCEITDVFSQYDWTWGFDNGQVFEDLDPVVLNVPAANRRPVTGTVVARDIVTGVERRDVVRTDLPLGARVTNPRFQYVAPGATESVDVYGYYLDGLRELSLAVELPRTTTIADVSFEGGLADLGFQASRDDSLDSFVKLSFRSDNALDFPGDELLLARIFFTNAADTLDAPQQRRIFIRNATAVRDTISPDFTQRDAQFLADAQDCNDNQLGDTMELLARRSFVDRSDDGRIDYCQDCNDNGAKDGEEIVADFTIDVDVNGVPDECDCNSDGQFDSAQLADPGQAATLDRDGDGEIDACDCDSNGRVDLVEIRELIEADPNDDNFFRFAEDLPDSQKYVTVPYNRAFDYVASIDRIDGNPVNDQDPAVPQPDGVLDFCQDCDENGTLDFLQYTVVLGTDLAGFLGIPARSAERARVDLDRNRLLDDCDCDGNNRFDRGEIEVDPAIDADDDGLIDDCDCNDNGTNDLLDIRDAIVRLIDAGGNDVRYESTLDANSDQEIDGCQDCDDNGQLDGPQLAEDLRRDIDGNRLLDACDCNSDNNYGPSLTIPTSEGPVANPLCDCDGDDVADLLQIGPTATNLTVVDGVITDYDSPIDSITIINPNPDPLPRDVQTPQPIIYRDGPDGVPDRCQDCDDNGVFDFVEVSRDRRYTPQPNPKDLDRNGLLDACDCNLDDELDSVEIDRDGQIDGDCDCDDNGTFDIVEIQGNAQFVEVDGEFLYTNSPGFDDDGNLVLDACEVAQARKLLQSSTGRFEQSRR